MKKLYFVLFVITIGLLTLNAQPTVNGDLSDENYTTVGTYSGTNDGFGEFNNLKNLKIFANETDLYIGVGADLASGNRVILFLNFSEYGGRASGNNLGNFSGGSGNLPSGGNTNVRMGLEVDYAMNLIDLNQIYLLMQTGGEQVAESVVVFMVHVI